MRGATFFFAAAVLVGLVTNSALATDPHSRRSYDNRVNVQTVGHPGMYPRHYSYNPPGHGRHGYPYGHHHGARPVVIQPRIPGHPPVMYPYPVYPPVAFPPVYPGYRPGCGSPYPHQDFYYRGNGWGFSFSF
jgi:hypothetical protein